jgi:hypothetical protein
MVAVNFNRFTTEGWFGPGMRAFGAFAQDGALSSTVVRRVQGDTRRDSVSGQGAKHAGPVDPVGSS